MDNQSNGFGGTRLGVIRIPRHIHPNMARQQKFAIGDSKNMADGVSAHFSFYFIQSRLKSHYLSIVLVLDRPM